MNRLTRTIAVVVLAAVGLLVSAPAYAADDATLTKIKAEVTRRIDLRLAALSKFEATLSVAKHITADHKSTLTSLISSDRSGLTTLKTKVAGETTAAALKADATSMVNDYRIYILVGPKVRLSIAGDAEAAALSRLADVHAKLTELVAKAKAGGADTTAAEQDLADMKAALDKGTSDLNGQVAKVLALQPGPDGPGLRASVTAVRAALGTVRSDLRTAVAEAKHVRQFLRSV